MILVSAFSPTLYGQVPAGTAFSYTATVPATPPAMGTATPDSTDALGRVTAESDLGGAASSASDYTWEGPANVSGPDGPIAYTYTPWGAVQTQTVANPSGGSVVTSFGYDAAGNVVSTATSGGGLTVTATAEFDAQGRQVAGTDASGRHTTVVYTPSAQGTTVTTTTTAPAPTPTPTPSPASPTSTTEVDAYYLDGSPESVSGTAVTPSASDEGVDPATGDTWTQSGTPDGQDWTRVYTNLLGQQYKTVQNDATAPGGIVTATTVFDANGRPVQSTGFDDATTFTDYDPITGTVKDTWLYVNGDGT